MDRKRLITSIVTYGGGDFLVLAVGGLLLLPLYTRHLDPAAYGVFVVTKTNSDIFNYLLQFGLISAVSRVYFIYRAKQQEAEYLGSILIFQFLLAAVVFALFWLAGGPVWRLLSPGVPAQPFMWFAFALAFFAFVPALFTILLRLEERAGYFVAIQAGSALLLTLLVVLLLVVFKAGVIGLLYGVVLTSLVTWLVVLVLLLPRLRWRFQWEHVAVSLKFGIPVVVGYFAFFFINKFSIVFLQRHVDLAQVGFFGLAQQLALVITLVSLAFGKTFQPIIYSAPADGVAEIVSRLGRIYFPCMLLGTTVVLSFASEALSIVAPRSYGHSYYLFLILAASNLIYSFSMLSDSVLLYCHRPNLSLSISLLGGLVSVLSNVWLVPSLRIYGAVLSVLLTSSVVAMATFLVARKMMAFRIEASLWWYVLGSAAVVAFSVFLNGRLGMVPGLLVKFLLVGLLVTPIVRRLRPVASGAAASSTG
ncbi:MAG: oligosaccharide flippase family protein [Acidobacteriota bacterium]|nr:oligosaccharide flippase family protein [Acidobacteriota bacterium]